MEKLAKDLFHDHSLSADSGLVAGAVCPSCSSSLLGGVTQCITYGPNCALRDRISDFGQ